MKNWEKIRKKEKTRIEKFLKKREDDYILIDCMLDKLAIDDELDELFNSLLSKLSESGKEEECFDKLNIHLDVRMSDDMYSSRGWASLYITTDTPTIKYDDAHLCDDESIVIPNGGGITFGHSE